MLIKHYEMIAAAGEGAALKDALTALAEAVKAAGCDEVEMLADSENPAAIIFIERWASDAAYDASRGQIPKQITAPITAALASPPVGRTLRPV